MKNNYSYFRIILISLIICSASLFNFAKAQTDTTKVTQPDTTSQVKAEEPTKVDRKRRDEFGLFIGSNFNQLAIESADFESSTNVGYHLGGYYKRGRFFYWQVAARFCNAGYSLDNLTSTADSSNDFSVRSFDLPLTAGINVLSATDRILALRIFVSAVPAFNLGVGENDLMIDKDKINQFILYGQGGVGVNVAFLVIEAGYNYGLQDLIKDTKSVPGQVFINLGFRF